LWGFMRQAGMIVPSQNETGSEQRRVFVDGEIKKLRFWRLDRNQLADRCAEFNKADGNHALPRDQQIR
uniref:hypothetical protein n=1 Tax=Stenotrophomonas maltophilia TaxID=40324 RepID=UPI0013DA834E